MNVTVLAGLPVVVTQAPHFNPQTGLFEERVRVLNPTPFTVSGIRLFIRNLQAGMQVFNATGSSNGIAYVQTKLPILAGESADLTIEYYVTNFQTPNPTLSAEVAGPNLQAASLDVTTVPMTRQLRLPSGDFFSI